jgi:predicted double-glycine peptidase
MVLDYYNAQNTANKTLSAQQIVDMSDAADRTNPKGISPTSLTDELETLGYKNIDVKINAQYSDLQTAIKDGPVIVTAGVKLTGDGIIKSSGSRALVGPGNITHAMVVSGVGDEQVLVNDPWSGTQVKLSKETFEKMWTRGSGGMYSIRP